MVNPRIKQSKPFGLWPSPITPDLLSKRIRLEDVRWDSDGRSLVWAEGRSGVGVLLSQTDQEARLELSGACSVRGGVGYGGGEFDVSNGVVVFAERGGQLFRRKLFHESPTPITPAFGACAAPALSPDGRWLAYVFSDGDTDLIGLTQSNGRDWPLQLVHGADFYMQLAWHPSGSQLAWVEWDHPNMPWDGTRLMLGQLSGSPPRLIEHKKVAGDNETPASQPQFSPDGRWLSYIAAHGDWDRLVVLDLESGAERTLIAGEGFLLAPPAWVQGVRSYGWSHDSRLLYHVRNYAGRYTLWKTSLESGDSQPVDIAPYTWLGQLAVSPVREELAFIASAPGIPERIVRWDGQDLHTVARSQNEMIPPEMYSLPQEITWNAPDGSPVHGLYYPPQHTHYTSEGLPPAIVYVHGGPTSATNVQFSPEAAYFTSRGYAWLAVNYRGSTGYGHGYEKALYERWGEVDVEDAAGGAKALAQQGLANPGQIVIYGGSAGGYTVLNALIRYPGLFKAGVCLYGVSNLFTLDLDTHKFESHYNEQLVGALPEAAGRYRAWSPVFHADRIRDPLAIFQGSEDRVVPPSQSEEIVALLRQQGTPHIYRLYSGEGHGFRKSETVAAFLKDVEQFLQQQVLFAG
ncbi:MAG: S9 family peptidase [Chloroflexi bacterium]|nr:S9 family peptidase [Chloroflexota bacterium]